MSKSTKIGLAVIFAVFAVLALVTMTLSSRYHRASQRQALAQAKSVGIALRLYAEDHQGALPAGLGELIPEYLSDPKLVDRMTCLTPNAKLEQLPASMVVLRYSPPERRDALILVRADLSGEIVYP